MQKKKKSIKGFAMAELLAVSIVVLVIFSVLFSNFLPLVAEYENRVGYNEVTSQYAAYYLRKMYKSALETPGSTMKATITSGMGTKGYYKVFDNKSSTKVTLMCNQVLTDDKANCNNLVTEYEIEEVIITNYKTDKINYAQNAGLLYNYIKYLPSYSNTMYSGTDELYRIILKTKSYGYATTPILSDYATPASCFNLEYDTETGGFEIKGYKGITENCPDVVTLNARTISSGGRTAYITKIGDNAFKDKAIKNFTFSNKIKQVGNSAFEGTKLTNLNLPDSVTQLGDKAFMDTDIKTITIPANVTQIGSSAFEGTKLDSVTLGKGVKYGDRSFAKISTLNKITFNTDGDILTPGGEVSKGLFTESGTSSTGIAVTIPNKMEHLGEGTFKNAKMKSIAFASSSKLKSIGDSAFELKDENTNVMDNKTVTIPDTVTNIGANAFKNVGITELTLGKAVNKIGKSAFEHASINSSGITSLNLPNTIDSLGSSAFHDSGIQTLNFADDIKLNTISSSAFEENNIGGTLTIPESVTSIEVRAFSSNKLLTKLVLPSNIKTINDDTFSDCPDLVDITNKSNKEFDWCLIFYNSSDACSTNKENGNITVKYEGMKDKIVTYVEGGNNETE